MAERRVEGLQRVLGVYPLASSAYGNVGSSIICTFASLCVLAALHTSVEAKSLHAAAIVMPMSRDGAGFGRTLATVLRERPCRVIIESIPAPDRGRPTVAA